MNKYIAEFIGTFFLVLVVGLTGSPVAIGLTLALMVYTFASTSGSNFNPAVSFGLWINQKLSNYDFPRYVLSQLLGGAVAVLFIRLVMKKSMEVLLPADTSVLMGIALEALFTFLFVTVIYNVAVKKSSLPNQYFGFAIGLTIFVAATAVGKLTGGAFNPAVGLMPVLLNTETVSVNTNSLIVYFVGPMLGALCAAFLYRYMKEDLSLIHI